MKLLVLSVLWVTSVFAQDRPIFRVSFAAGAAATVGTSPAMSIGNCPLWTYILAEAAKNQETVEIPVTENKQITTPRLGPVGGRIVAEVFLGMLFGDPDSMLGSTRNGSRRREKITG
jgi:hypothetical protein